jgi:hypothetical protein
LLSLRSASSSMCMHALDEKLGASNYQTESLRGKSSEIFIMDVASCARHDHPVRRLTQSLHTDACNCTRLTLRWLACGSLDLLLVISWRESCGACENLGINTPSSKLVTQTLILSFDPYVDQSVYCFLSSSVACSGVLPSISLRLYTSNTSSLPSHCSHQISSWHPLCSHLAAQ